MSPATHPRLLVLGDSRLLDMGDLLTTGGTHSEVEDVPAASPAAGVQDAPGARGCVVITRWGPRQHKPHCPCACCKRGRQLPLAPALPPPPAPALAPPRPASGPARALSSGAAPSSEPTLRSPHAAAPRGLRELTGLSSVLGGLPLEGSAKSRAARRESGGAPLGTPAHASAPQDSADMADAAAAAASEGPTEAETMAATPPAEAAGVVPSVAEATDPERAGGGAAAGDGEVAGREAVGQGSGAGSGAEAEAGDTDAADPKPVLLNLRHCLCCCVTLLWCLNEQVN